MINEAKRLLMCLLPFELYVHIFIYFEAMLMGAYRFTDSVCIINPFMFSFCFQSFCTFILNITSFIKSIELNFITFTQSDDASL